MSIRLRISIPPPITGNFGLDLWAQQITDALNQLPGFSIISTSNGPNSVETADPGIIGIDIGSSNTTFWVKASGETTTGWLAMSLV